MGKITTYIIFLSVMVILLYAFNFITCSAGSTCTPNAVILDFLLHPENLWNTSWYKIMIGLITALGVAAVIIGLFISSKSETAIKAPIIVFLFSIGFDLVVMFNQLKQTNILVATLLISPMAVVFFLAVIEWGFGHD